MRGQEGGVCPHACRAGMSAKKTSQELWSRKGSCIEGSHTHPCAPDLFSTCPVCERCRSSVFPVSPSPLSQPFPPVDTSLFSTSPSMRSILAVIRS